MLIEHCRAVVTGGASGLGAAVVHALRARGAAVAVLDLNTATLATGELAALPHFDCDVSDETAVDAAMRSAQTALGGLNLLVNCAGIIGAARVLGRDGVMPGEFFARVIRVNLIGSFLCDKAAAAIMQHNATNADGERGVIVHTASVAAWEGQVGQAAYAASKAGLAGMTLPLAREFANFGIRCVSIAPGIFATPMAAALPPETQAQLAAQVPFPKRLGKPAEFAELVLAIVSNPMINGTTIRIDGAMRMQPR